MHYVNLLARILFSFRGAIDRRSYLIGMVIAAIAYTFSPVKPPNVGDLAGSPTLLSQLWDYVWLIPLAAITVKRVRDIGWPVWLGYIYPAVVGLSFLPWSMGWLPARNLSDSASATIQIYLLATAAWVLICVFVRGSSFAGSQTASAMRS
jgi:uncharacterized membrane protein YhaH (DUF805 family)